MRCKCNLACCLLFSLHKFIPKFIGMCRHNKRENVFSTILKIFFENKKRTARATLSCLGFNELGGWEIVKEKRLSLFRFDKSRISKPGRAESVDKRKINIILFVHNSMT